MRARATTMTTRAAPTRPTGSSARISEHTAHENEPHDVTAKADSRGQRQPMPRSRSRTPPTSCCPPGGAGTMIAPGNCSSSSGSSAPLTFGGGIIEVAHLVAVSADAFNSTPRRLKNEAQQHIAWPAAASKPSGAGQVADRHARPLLRRRSSPSRTRSPEPARCAGAAVNSSLASEQHPQVPPQVSISS